VESRGQKEAREEKEEQEEQIMRSASARSTVSTIANFFSRIDRSSLPPDATTETDTAVLRDWATDREAQKLTKLAYALGVGRIVLADRDINKDENWVSFIGQYICARDSREAHQKRLKPWCLSPKQLATVNRALCSGCDVILLSHESCGDFAATLAHEIGHYINRRLGGLSRSDLNIADFSRVTNNTRRPRSF
jgi:hypothetical protein